MYRLLIIVMLLTGCANIVNMPIVITRIDQMQNTEGSPICSLKLKGVDPIWTTYSPDNCVYKVGDVLK